MSSQINDCSFFLDICANCDVIALFLALLHGHFRRDVGAVHADLEGVVIVMKDREELVGVSHCMPSELRLPLSKVSGLSPVILQENVPPSLMKVKRVGSLLPPQ